MAILKELREKAARTLTEARSMLDGIKEDATPEQRAEAEQAVDRALDEVSQIEAKIERQERLDAAEARMREAQERVDESRRPQLQGEGRGRDDGDMPSYREAFHAWLRSKSEDGEPLTAEQRQVLRAGFGEVEIRAQTTTNTAGGYSVPETMMERIIVSMKAWGPMYEGGPFTELVTAGGNAMPFPTIDDTGVTPEPHTEGATLTDDGGKDMSFGTKQLDAYAYNTEWLRISKELMDDSFIAMETFTASRLGERLARLANAQLTVGTGSSAPNGIVTASAQGVVAAANNSITWDEIMDLEHSVDPAYRNGPSVGYMFNDTTLLAARKLKDGDGNYLWQAGNVVQGVPASFNGRPYWINQDMPGLASGVNSRVMLFGDMSRYIVRKVGQPLIGAISDKDFWPGIGVAGYIRFDGELEDTAAIKHLALAAA